MARPFGTTIAQCPKCSATIGDEHPYTWCVECGEHFSEKLLSMFPKVQASQPSPVNIPYHFKKPGAWLWTPQRTASFAADAENGLIKHDWHFRPDGDDREYTLDEILQIEAKRSEKAEYRRAIRAFQAEPLPPPPDYPAASSPMGTLLSRYLDRYVGVNHRDPKKFERVLLTKVSDAFFTIFVADNQTKVSFPLRYVLSVTEAEGGVSTGVIFREQFTVIIQVYHLVIYSGAVGASFPI